jgi:hypothetical protein
MATYTIFGTGAPSGVIASGDTGNVSVSTAFYVLGVTGWHVQAIRVWVPAGTTISSSTYKAYLWIGTGSTPDSILATVDFTSFTAGAWNTVAFSSPISLIAGRYYWAQVFFPGGNYGVRGFSFTPSSLVSVDSPSLYAGSNSETTPGNGSFVYGAAGLAPLQAFHSSWYGVDVLVDDGSSTVGPVAGDDVGIADSVVAVRSGLPTTVHATGSATDGLSTPVVATPASLSVGGATALHTIRRSLFEARIQWGSAVNTNVTGPSPSTDSPLTLGMTFYTQWNVRFIGGNIYKAPNAHGSIPVRLWDHQGASGAPRELGNTTLTWVADAGGWREVLFSPPIDLVPNVEYIMSYYSPSGDFMHSTWVFQQPSVEPPLENRSYGELAGGERVGGAVFNIGTAQVVPATHTASNYYLDPTVEWDSNEPLFVPDPDNTYYDQWVNWSLPTKFPFAIWGSDAQYIQEYYDMGFKLCFGDGSPAKVAASISADMTQVIHVGPDGDPQKIGLRAIAENSAFADKVGGYMVVDEPDQLHPYAPPDTIRGWIREIRLNDSTRPINIGMGRVIGINGTFYHQPQGSDMYTANQLWRDWAQLADFLDGDMYTLANESNQDGIWGVWTYPRFVRRLKNLVERRIPVWVTVESTSETPGQPLPDQVVKAVWGCLIEGANGINFFDHRFGNALVARDFAHMLHNPPMKAAVSALGVRVESLADALNSPDTDIVTAVTSSNVTAGPLGGTYGVPMHYCTKADATHEYLFAMGIRPGSTTATFTIPSWAGLTITVLDESRTVVVSGAGVLTDSFPADYTVHLYRR